MNYSFMVSGMLIMNFYGLIGMEMQEKDDIEKNSTVQHIVSSEKEHKAMSDFLVTSFSIEIDSIRPFLIKNIKELQVSKPKEYRLLRRLQKDNPLHVKKKKKKDSLIKAHRIASRLLIDSYNDCTIDCDKTIFKSTLLNRFRIGAIVVEITLAFCFLAGALPPILINC